MSYSNYYPSSGMFHVSIPLLMGTRMDVLLFGDDRQPLESFWTCAEQELKRMEKMLNRFDPASETAKINSDAAFAAVGLSDELWRILLDCRRYYESTDGYFDVTLSDFDKIIFMEESHSISFDKYGMALDFGGYAKGYALKILRKRLEEAGIKRALLNFGNSAVLALGVHPYGDSWPVGIEDPVTGVTLKTVDLCDTCLSVSGNMPSNKEHIVNPKTAGRVTGNEMTAIISDDPVDAETLTTAWIASEDKNIPDWMMKFNLKKTYRIK